MSIECGECEHDLRSGHEEDCSRNPHRKRPGMCRWWVDPLTYPSDGRFCSRKAIPGSEYCKQHAKMNGEFRKKK